MIQAVGERCPCLVAVPENREVWLKRALDVGCDGLIVPQIRSAGEARAGPAMVPLSTAGEPQRGHHPRPPVWHGLPGVRGLANALLTVVLQVEHVEAVEHIEEIVAVPGSEPSWSARMTSPAASG